MKANFVITCGLGMAGIVGATYEYDDVRKMQYMELKPINNFENIIHARFGFKVAMEPATKKSPITPTAAVQDPDIKWSFFTA